MLVVPLAGMTVLALYTQESRQDTYANLQAIARLKAEQLESWLSEREGDAQVLMGSETTSNSMRLLAHGKMEPASLALSNPTITRGSRSCGPTAKYF